MKFRNIFVGGAIIGLALAMDVPTAMAFPSMLSQFNTEYGTAGTRLDTCGLCHNDFSSGTRNPYGLDYKNNGFNFSVIELMDSDGDGTNNLDEITGRDMPGYTCDTVGATSNGPPDLSSYVEPGGCNGNTAPLANAGPDQTVKVGDTVTLDGSASSDADSDPLTYTWSFFSLPAGTSATLSDIHAVKPSFVVDKPGFYTVQLIVNDGTVDSAADFVNINTENSPPTADAGPDQTVTAGQSVTLDGSGSTDVDGDALTYTWSLTTKPTGSTATLSNQSAVMPTFVADLEGSYKAQLVVNDGVTDSAPNTVTITAGTGNTPPIANAGPDQIALIGTSVMLDGNSSTDVDGDPLTYSWSLITKPAGSTATLSDPNAVSPIFDVDMPGTYVAQLIVNDGTVDSPPDTVTITTEGNTLPVADAGPDQSVTVGSNVMLDGGASHDADGDLLTYSWSFISTPMGSAASLSDSSGTKPTFVADLAGMYVVQLIVNDGTADSAPNTVKIDAQNQEPPVGSNPGNQGHKRKKDKHHSHKDTWQDNTCGYKGCNQQRQNERYQVDGDKTNQLDKEEQDD